MRCRGGKELRLLEGLHVLEVEVAARALEAPRRRVICALRPTPIVEGAEGDVEFGGTELGVEGTIGPHVDAAKAQ
jgi:hypothetical protein